MNKLVEEVLSHGGVEVPSLHVDADFLAILESWLGLPSSKPWEIEMMEDCAPFDPPIYQALERLLISVWKPEEITAMLHSNALLELAVENPKEMSLYKALDSIRITRMLRYWMELNVVGRNTIHLEGQEDDEDVEKTLSHCLLEHCSRSEDGTTPTTKYPLIQALYHHIEQLPQLQAHMNFYTQSLMRGERNLSSSGQALSNPQSRLQQYQEAQGVAAKLNHEWEDHIDALEHIVGEWYTTGSVDIRRQSRSHLGSVWSQFVTRSSGGTGGVKIENTSSSGVHMTLRVLHRILQGTSTKLEKAHGHLLTYHLIPLHRPSGMVLWRDQTSMLELYHEPLVQCIAILLQKKPEWIPKTIAALLEPEIWTKGGNTPKLVLLLHEIDTYIGILPNPINASILGECLISLLRTLGLCMASDHSRLCERALAFMKNKKFQTLVELNFEQSLSRMLPFLVRSEPAWNPTVRKMTYNVLKTFQNFDEDRFLQISNKCFPNEGSMQEKMPSAVVPPAKSEGTAKTASYEGIPQPPRDFTLKSAMGEWKPPTSVGTRQHTVISSTMPPPSSRAPRGAAAPPLAVTGIAPWAMNRSTIPSSKSRKNPPLGVTGVAPWAVQKKPPMNVKRRAVEPLSGVKEGDKSEETSADENSNGQQQQLPRVLAYMAQIKPPEEEGGASSWARAQMAKTPTLLPKLKFHDLVFGHDLGEGAFGHVRYARLIDRSRSRSQWPEYAVKVISTEKIKEMGYETSVQREISVLRVLSHPGIARLISSFRFREGVYLILEYASGGDLHSLLRKNGSLDHDSTRFVIGEVVAALSSIHDMGLVYADLKPENIVITEPGHVKLTDFGGCRPVTEEAKNMIGLSEKNLLKDLRDGDWKPQQQNRSDGFDMMDEEEDVDPVDDSDYHPNNDIRIEGTTAYLPPEVVMGQFPTPAADSWALGCVFYQCLSGRPPILETDETLTKKRIVSFDVKKPVNDDEAFLFSDSHASSINADARKLITSLLNRHARERPRMTQVAQSDFFVKAGTDVFSLYRQQAHPLDVGDVSPVADAQWSRRQFSSIWAPQPQAYDISTETDTRNPSSRGLSSGPIAEGGEATAFFSKTSTLPSILRNISEKIPLPLSKRSIAEEMV